MNKFTLSLTLGLISVALLCQAQPSIPVDPFTGRANVSIPIWNLSNKYLDVPIVLSNNGNGMKLTEGEGSAGIGWNVIAGGEISREVRGVPDDAFQNGATGKKGWLHVNSDSIKNFSPVGDNNLTVCSDEIPDYNYINSLKIGIKDTEPDIFNLNAPGLSGQFYFDHSKNIVFSPYQDLDVDYVLQNGTQALFSFTVTRNDGVKYQFNVVEYADMHAKPFQGNASWEYDAHPFKVQKSFISAWKLSTITMPDSKTITFLYSDPRETESREYRRWLNKTTNKIDTLYTVTNLSTSHQLRKIKDELNDITISYINNQLVSSINVLRHGIPTLPGLGVKKFFLDYVQVRDASDTEQENIGRKYFLKSLKETNDNCVSFPSYKFEYYNVDLIAGVTDLPIKNGFAQDYWGYYNGAGDNAGNLIPALYYNANAEGAERMRIRPNPNVSGYTQLSGFDRNTNTSTVYYGALKRVYYPPGGYGEITYEAADYYDSLATSSYLGGGVRVAQIRMSDGDPDVSNDVVTSYQYKRADNESSGKLIYPPVFAWFNTSYERSPDNMAPDGSVYYSRVTVSQSGRGKTVYEYHLPGAYAKTSQGDWEAPYTRIARSTIASSTCSAYSIFKNGYFTYPYTPSTNYGFERGRLVKMSAYSQSDVLVKETSYNYSRVGPTPIYTYGMRGVKADDNAWTYTKYKLIANTAKITVKETSKTFDPASPSNFVQTSVDYNYDPGHYLLSSTLLTNSDGSIFKTEIKYAKDFSALTSPTEPYAQAIKSLNDNFRHGVAIETIQKITPPGGSETVIGAELTAYLTFTNAGGLVLPGETWTFNGTSGFNGSHISGTSQFLINSPYRKVLTIIDYDQYGNVLSLEDLKRNSSSFLYTTVNKYGTSNGIYPLPRAAFSLAKHNEVFHNLFDFVPIVDGATTYQPQDYVGVATNPYTGGLAMSIPVATTLSKAGIVKAANTNYRFTARVRSASAVTMTIRAVNGASNVSKSIPISTTGIDWIFIEDLLDISSVPSPFTFELQTSGPIDIDEVLLYPNHAEVTTHTYNLFGKLSDTDSRGVSGFIEYDQNGKMVFLKDQDKNVLQYNEYAYKKEQEEALTANFTTSFAKSNAQGIFKAQTGCVEEVNYKWFVNDVERLSGPTETTFSYYFTSSNPRIRLEVTAPGFVTAVREDTLVYNVPSPVWVPPTNDPCSPNPTLTMTGSTTFDPCNNPGDSGIRNMSLVYTDQTCVTGAYLEYLTMDTNGATTSEWTVYLPGTTSWDFGAIPIAYQSVAIRGVVVTPGGVFVSNSVGITYVFNPNCQ